MALKTEPPDRTAAQVAVVLAAHGAFTPFGPHPATAFAAAGFTRARPEAAPLAVFGRFEAEQFQLLGSLPHDRRPIAVVTVGSSPGRATFAGRYRGRVCGNRGTSAHSHSRMWAVRLVVRCIASGRDGRRLTVSASVRSVAPGPRRLFAMRGLRPQAP